MFADGNATNWGAISTDGADPGVQAFGPRRFNHVFIGYVRFWPFLHRTCPLTFAVAIRGEADMPSFAADVCF